MVSAGVNIDCNFAAEKKSNNSQRKTTQKQTIMKRFSALSLLFIAIGALANASCLNDSVSTTDDITTSASSDDSGIDMSGNASGTEAWLRRIGVLKTSGSTAEIAALSTMGQKDEIYTINGLKLKEAAASGPYIVNGKKVYLKF